jgi:hypothetical protein
VGDNGKGQEEDVRTALRSLHIGRFWSICKNTVLFVSFPIW